VKKYWKISCILFGATLLYGFCIVFFQTIPNFDLQSYHQIGTLTLKGIHIYPDPAISRHPYLPLFLYFEAAVVFISTQLHIPETILFKSFFTLFHLISLVYFYELTHRNWKTTLFYALNPISLLAIALHGQFDILPVTLLLFALTKLKQKQNILVVLALSLAIALKTWPILFVYPYLRRMPKKQWLLLPLIPSIFLLLYSFVFRTSLWQIFYVLLRYQGVETAWGGGFLLSLLTTNKWVYFVYKLIFVAGFVHFSITQKKQKILNELTMLFILFFVATPGFGIQWVVWLVPFLLLSNLPFAFLLFVPLFLMQLSSYLSWEPLAVLHTSQVTLVFLSSWICIGVYFLFITVILPRIPRSAIRTIVY